MNRRRFIAAGALLGSAPAIHAQLQECPTTAPKADDPFARFLAATAEMDALLEELKQTFKKEFEDQLSIELHPGKWFNPPGGGRREICLNLFLEENKKGGWICVTMSGENVSAIFHTGPELYDQTPPPNWRQISNMFWARKGGAK